MLLTATSAFFHPQNHTLSQVEAFASISRFLKKSISLAQAVHVDHASTSTHNHEWNMAAKTNPHVTSRPLVIYINHPDQIVKQTLLEFADDLGNRAAGFDSGDDLQAKWAGNDAKADVVITSLAAIANVDSEAITFFQKMHQHQPTVALILITDGGTDLTASEAAECGVHFFLREPIRLSEVEFYLTRI
jgi:hypothetical protein